MTSKKRLGATIVLGMLLGSVSMYANYAEASVKVIDSPGTYRDLGTVEFTKYSDVTGVLIKKVEGDVIIGGKTSVIADGNKMGEIPDINFSGISGFGRGGGIFFEEFGQNKLVFEEGSELNVDLKNIVFPVKDNEGRYVYGASFNYGDNTAHIEANGKITVNISANGVNYVEGMNLEASGGINKFKDVNITLSGDGNRGEGNQNTIFSGLKFDGDNTVWTIDNLNINMEGVTNAHQLPCGIENFVAGKDTVLNLKQTNINVGVNGKAIEHSGSGIINVNTTGNDDVVIVGNILGAGTEGLVDERSTINVNLNTEKSSFTGRFWQFFSDGHLSLSNGAVWNAGEGGDQGVLRNDLNSLRVESGATVNLRSSSGENYKGITVQEFSGSGGNFIMGTDVNMDQSDEFLIMKGTSAASGTIQIYDKSLVAAGDAVVGPKKLSLVYDRTGLTTWTGKSLDTGGLWTITPTLEKQGDRWYLVLGEKENPNPEPEPDPKPEIKPEIKPEPEVPIIKPNPSTETTLGAFDSGYSLWHMAMTDDTLRKRLGDLRYEGENDAGIWTRVKTGKLSGSGYDNSYQTYQIGYDKKVANTAYGLAVDHSKAKSQYAVGSGDGTMTTLSLYVANYHQSGAYSDIVLKTGKLRNDVKSLGQYPDSLDYDTWAYSLSYELGRTITNQNNGWFVEPQAQFVYGHMSGGDYTTNKGVAVDKDGIDSFIGRVGFTAGRKINKDSDYYLKANIYREFAGNNDMRLVGKNSFGDIERMVVKDKNKDTWFELGVGGNVRLANKTYLYGDVLKTFGANIDKKWQVNAGVRWQF